MKVTGADRVAKNLSKMSDEMFRNVVDAAEAVQAKVINEAQAKAPVQTGNLRQSIQAGDITVRNENITAVVVANADYASYVEFGTRPHFPPVSALEPWAGKVLGDESLAFVVARAISRRGLPKRPFLFPALLANMSTFRKAIRAAVKR